MGNTNPKASNENTKSITNASVIPKASNESMKNNADASVIPKVWNEKMKSYANAANPKVWNEKIKSCGNAKVFNEKMKTFGESSVTRVNKEDGKKFELMNVLDVTQLSIFGYYMLTLKVKDPEDGGKCKIYNTKASSSDDVRGKLIHTTGFKYVADCPCGDMYSKYRSLIEGHKGREGESGFKGEGGSSTEKQIVKKFMGNFRS